MVRHGESCQERQCDDENCEFLHYIPPTVYADTLSIMENYRGLAFYILWKSRVSFCDGKAGKKEK
jgi:hypothetical protein